MTYPMDRTLLTRTAFDIVEQDLQSPEYGSNILSSTHRAVLWQLIDTMSAYCAGQASGRKAFPLPTGGGKTSAIVAFLTALHRLDYAVPVSVAASRVEALCDVQEKLLGHGVAPAKVGLKHSLANASHASTGNEGRLFQLVTHARVRGGTDFRLFGEYEGQARPLCLYDETLMRSDVFAFSERNLRKALGVLGPEAADRPDEALKATWAYLQHCSEHIQSALASLRALPDATDCGLPVELPYLDEGKRELWATVLRRYSAQLGGFGGALSQLLEITHEPLQVLTTGQGDGFVSIRQVIPEGLRNVIVLDASTPIRELPRMDPTIECIDLPDIKSFEDVEVHQLLAAGGRSAIQHSYSGSRNETSAVSREVIDILRREMGEGSDRSHLIFNFMKRDNLDMTDRLKLDLARARIDPDGKTSNGRRRFEFLTWGQHEGLNGYSHCETVILAGVLHRKLIDVAAAIKGQKGNLGAPTPGDLVTHVLRSEVVHCIYQAASRGSCRTVRNGRALPMRLHLIHQDVALKDMLDRVMPGARWFRHDPVHLKKATTAGKTIEMLGQIVAHLQAIPRGIDKVLCSQVKAALPSGDLGVDQVFTRAGARLDLALHGWVRKGRTFLRGAAAYGFAPVGLS